MAMKLDVRHDRRRWSLVAGRLMRAFSLVALAACYESATTALTVQVVPAEVRWLEWPAQVATVCGIAVFGVLLGLGFHVVDWCEARVQQQGPETAAAFIRERDPDAKIWYVGFWGFKFHAERAGMRLLTQDVALVVSTSTADRLSLRVDPSGVALDAYEAPVREVMTRLATSGAAAHRRSVSL